MLEFSMWNPDTNGHLRRDDRMPDTPPSISRFHEIVLNQGRIERFFLDNIAKHSAATNHVSIQRGVLPLSLSLDESLLEDPEAHPVTVKLRHLSEEEARPEQAGGPVQDGLFRSNIVGDDTEDLRKRISGLEGEEEVLRAKYVVGCDGAHSWTRKQLGFELEGEPTDYIWGVLDIVPVTDFREFLVFSSSWIRDGEWLKY